MTTRTFLGLAIALGLGFTVDVVHADELVAAKAQPAVTTNSKLVARVESGAAVLVKGDARTVVVPDGVVSVHLSGSRLHVALGRGGALVFDATSPGAPQLVGRVPPSDVSITGFDDIGSETWMLVETRRALPMPEFPTRVGASAGDVKEPQPPAITAALPKAPDTPTPPVAPASKPAAARPWPNRVVRVAAVSPGEVTIDAGKADGLAVGDWIGVHRVLPASKLQPQFVERQRVSVVRVIAVKDDQSLCEVPRGARIRVGDALERAQAGEDALIYPDRQASILDVTATLRPLVKVGAPLGGGSSSTARSPTSARATSSARGSSPLAWAGRRKATSSRRASSPRPATTRSPWGSALASA